MKAKDTAFYPKRTLNCKGNLLLLDEPLIMGILNVTPDSFYDGGKLDSEDKILSHAGKMLQDGATIIDVGACSTRPGAAEVTEDEELIRLIPAIKIVANKYPEAIISADTFRSNVAKEAVTAGAAIINDISGGTDEKMFNTIAELNVPYILMHLKGSPANMQDNPGYDDVIKKITLYFSEKVSQLKRAGVQDIILDPGFGFGKTLEHNYTILAKLQHFNIFGLPVMVGISRKSMICKALGCEPESALNGTTAANTIALMKGANILRVHDVKEAAEAIRVFSFMQQSRTFTKKDIVPDTLD